MSRVPFGNSGLSSLMAFTIPRSSTSSNSTYIYSCAEERSIAVRNAHPYKPEPLHADVRETKPAEGLRPWRATRGNPQSSALRLCRPPLRYAPSTPLIAPFQGWGTPPLALAAPAGVGQGQGVFVSKHSTAIQKRRKYPMSSNVTTNETSNVTSLPAAPKPQISKEVIAANVKLLIEQLEAGHSEGLIAYLTAMGKFHNYSFGTSSKSHS